MNSQEEIGKLRRLLLQTAEYANRGAADRFVDLWEENGVVLAPETPPLCGTHNLFSCLVDFMRINRFECEFDAYEIKVEETYGYIYGGFYIRRTDEENGCIRVYSGNFLAVAHKTVAHKGGPESEWRLVHCCYNSGIPPVS